MSVVELFREDAYATKCAAVVTAAGDGVIELDRTVFYPTGGGQPGDRGRLVRPDGADLAILDTRKGSEPGRIVHAVEGELPAVGEAVTVEIDWARRYRHMRMHTCLHLLCALVPRGVTGGAVGDGRGRLDFDLGEASLDKEELARRLNALVVEDHPVAAIWVDEAELDTKPDLVRTLSVQPPRGLGRVRLMRIDGVDLQPCGGTHVRRTAEIGQVAIDKIESKGKRNRRVALSLLQP